MEGRVYCGSQVEGRVHHGGEGLELEAAGPAVPNIRKQREMNVAAWLLSPFCSVLDPNP